VHDDHGSFVGTVTLPAGSNEDDITATYDKGIFTLSVGVSEATPAEKHVTVRWLGGILGDVTLLCGEQVSDRLHHVGANPIHCFPQRKTFDSGLIDLPKRLLVCKDGFQMRSTVSVCRERQRQPLAPTDGWRCAGAPPDDRGRQAVRRVNGHLIPTDTPICARTRDRRTCRTPRAQSPSEGSLMLTGPRSSETREIFANAA